MRALSVTCNQCGGPVDVPLKAQLVTCPYCSSRLQIHRSESTVYTEVLEAFGKRIDHLKRETEILRLQNALERLDSRWLKERDEYERESQIAIRCGRQSVSAFQARFAFFVLWSIGFTAIALLILTSIWLAEGEFVGPMSLPMVFLVIGMTVLVVSTLNHDANVAKAKAFEYRTSRHEDRKRNYEEARGRIVAKLKFLNKQAGDGRSA